jgi:hypothetical protein
MGCPIGAGLALSGYIPGVLPSDDHNRMSRVIAIEPPMYKITWKFFYSSDLKMEAMQLTVMQSQNLPPLHFAITELGPEGSQSSRVINSAVEHDSEIRLRPSASLALTSDISIVSRLQADP